MYHLTLEGPLPTTLVFTAAVTPFAALRFTHESAIRKDLLNELVSELASELANEAEITILSARDTTRAWVPGRGIMGRNVGVYKNWYNTWLSSKLQNQPRSFRFVLFNFFSLFSSCFFRYHASSRIGCSNFIFVKPS